MEKNEFLDLFADVLESDEKPKGEEEAIGFICTAFGNLTEATMHMAEARLALVTGAEGTEVIEGEIERIEKMALEKNKELLTIANTLTESLPENKRKILKVLLHLAQKEMEALNE